MVQPKSGGPALSEGDFTVSNTGLLVDGAAKILDTEGSFGDTRK